MNKSMYYVTYGYWWTHIGSMCVAIEDDGCTLGVIAQRLAKEIAHTNKYDDVNIINFWKL